MKVPSNNSPRHPDLSPKTVPVDRLFQSGQNPPGSFPSNIADTYYSPSEQGKLLCDVVADNQARYRQLLEEAVQTGRMTPEESALKEKNFVSGKLGPRAHSSTSPLLRELENEQFCLLRHPQQVADGLYRTQDYYIPPAALTATAQLRGWETSQDVPVADTIVIGAGPGGLTTAWQLARRGGRVVVFESEIAGAAFSDAGARAVHSLRTSADGTNLVQEGHALATLEHPLSLHGHLADYRSQANLGRQAEAALTGLPSHGVAPESEQLEDRNAPATRGELFQHLAQLSHSLVQDFPDAFLCERSPVEEVTFEDGLFTVTSSRGHKMKGKNLVLATGLTGPQGQLARTLGLFEDMSAEDRDKLLILSNDSDQSVQAETLTQLSRGKDQRALIVHDRQLGSQMVRQSILALPEGSRAAVMGSGESAIKAALEMAHLNPGIKVDLFVKNTLEAAQTQIPNENFHTAVLENTLSDEQAIAKAWDRVKLFGTPITPRSLQEILELQQAGRVRLLEMGRYFDKESVRLEAGSNGQIKVELKDTEARVNLQKSHEQMKSKGLLPTDSQPFESSHYKVMVEALGYQKQSLQEHPLRHLPPEAHKKMHLNTAGLPNHPAETSLAGLSVRGRQLAEQLAQDIPQERRLEISVPQERGIDWREVDEETVQGIIANRGVHPGFARSVRRDIEEFGSHPQQDRLIFPSSDNKLRDWNRQREQGRISPAEREVLERAEQLGRRMSES